MHRTNANSIYNSICFPPPTLCTSNICSSAAKFDCSVCNGHFCSIGCAGVVPQNNTQCCMDKQQHVLRIFAVQHQVEPRIVITTGALTNATNAAPSTQTATSINHPATNQPAPSEAVATGFSGYDFPRFYRWRSNRRSSGSPMTDIEQAACDAKLAELHAER